MENKYFIERESSSTWTDWNEYLVEGSVFLRRATL